MIAPALAPATLTQRRTGFSGCSANPTSAPASPSPLTPPPRKTPSASSTHSMFLATPSSRPQGSPQPPDHRTSWQALQEPGGHDPSKEGAGPLDTERTKWYVSRANGRCGCSARGTSSREGEEAAVPREGVDYAWHHGVNVDAFRQDGISFAVRYLSNDVSKNLSRSEAQLLSDAGLDVAVVWETTATRALDGKSAGATDARKAVAQAKDCGMPASRPIYFGVDFDATDQDKPRIADYLRGAASVLGGKRVGVYGGYWVIKYCFDHAVASFGWQTYAWSGGQRDQRAQLYQHANGVIIGGINCDRDTARPDPQCHSGVDALERQQIARWQKRMAERGWRIEATGVFSRQSQRICSQFQAEKGIDPADGTVHADTWKKAWTAAVT